MYDNTIAWFGDDNVADRVKDLNRQIVETTNAHDKDMKKKLQKLYNQRVMTGIFLQQMPYGYFR